MGVCRDTQDYVREDDEESKWDICWIESSVVWFAYIVQICVQATDIETILTGQRMWKSV